MSRPCPGLAKCTFETKSAVMYSQVRTNIEFKLGLYDFFLHIFSKRAMCALSCPTAHCAGGHDHPQFAYASQKNYFLMTRLTVSGVLCQKDQAY